MAHDSSQDREEELYKVGIAYQRGARSNGYPTRRLRGEGHSRTLSDKLANIQIPENAQTEWLTNRHVARHRLKASCIEVLQPQGSAVPALQSFIHFIVFSFMPPCVSLG